MPGDVRLLTDSRDDAVCRALNAHFDGYIGTEYPEGGQQTEFTYYAVGDRYVSVTLLLQPPAGAGYVVTGVQVLQTFDRYLNDLGGLGF